jgi:uncharacterized protein with PIN domain
MRILSFDAKAQRTDLVRRNFGDCFAYVLAKERGCPLLYVGDNFAKTDVKSAL